MLLRWLLFLLLAVPGFTQAGSPCRPIANLTPLLQPGTILLLGEIHGTMESPAFALDVACHASRADLPVALALELTSSEAPRVEAYLTSAGSEDDRRALLLGNPWQSGYQDGRTSRAMFDLIEGARRLRGTGSTVEVVLFDAAGDRGGQQRDRDMASNLAHALQRAPEALAIVLTGNVHSRTTPGVPWNTEYEPMGYLLGQQMAGRPLVALDVAHGGGSAWTCNPECGVSNLRGRHGDLQWVVERDEETRPPGHAGWYHVGVLSAARPAVQAASGQQPPATVPPPRQSSPRSGDPAQPATGSRPRSPEPASVTAAPTGPLTVEETKFQGRWQAYEVDSSFKLWLFEFDGRSFTAHGAEDDWYQGNIAIGSAAVPQHLDFVIEDCVCNYKGMTSQAIYRWNGDALVLSAPTPGSPRPQQFDASSGQMMRLLRDTP